jgi:hypothetical protein
MLKERAEIATTHASEEQLTYRYKLKGHINSRRKI